MECPGSTGTSISQPPGITAEEASDRSDEPEIGGIYCKAVFSAHTIHDTHELIAA